VGSRFVVRGPCFLSVMGWGRNLADLQSANTSATSTRAVTARIPAAVNLQHILTVKCASVSRWASRKSRR